MPCPLPCSGLGGVASGIFIALTLSPDAPAHRLVVAAEATYPHSTAHHHAGCPGVRRAPPGLRGRPRRRRPILSMARVPGPAATRSRSTGSLRRRYRFPCCPRDRSACPPPAGQKKDLIILPFPPTRRSPIGTFRCVFGRRPHDPSSVLLLSFTLDRRHASSARGGASLPLYSV